MRIALLGNQNSGKSTLFNLLTGLNQKVGNWPGVTIDMKSGIIKNTDYELIDLPGVYSLSPYSNEEKITREQIISGNIDCVINIVDATNIERSLYLTTQLLELDVKVIVVLNMSDMLAKKKLTIDDHILSSMLGCPVYRVSALKNIGVNELIASIEKVKEKQEIKIYDPFIEDIIEKISKSLTGAHKRFNSVKLLENDILLNIDLDVNEHIKAIKEKYDMDVVEVFASARYDFIDKLKEKCLKKEEIKESTTDKIDKVLLNKYFGIPIFIGIMFLVYFLSVGLVGSATVDLMEGLITSLSDATANLLTKLGASAWSNSLVVDGIIAGVGAVLSFIPQLIILFVLISLLESSGYMARISFLLDKFFKKFGLSGKSLIPFIVGTGCSVPGVMATRTIEDENERKMTILLTPFIPCSAKLPVIALFSGFFFKDNAGLISASLYFLSVIIIILTAIFLRKFVYKGSSTAYISELPELRLPSARYTLTDLYTRVIAYVKKAGSIILLSSIIIWFLSSFSIRFQYGVDVEDSILAIIGKGISWIFYPMLGEMSWGASVSAIQGIIAKEQVVSSMAIISGLDEANVFSSTGIFSFFTPVSAYAFVVFNLFSAPCLGTIGAMRKEYGSIKYALKAILFQTGLAWALGVFVYWIGRIIWS
jgi:ferrous iron transport protein B